YLDQQRRSMEKMRRAEKRVIPGWFDYSAVSGLSSEMKQTLSRVRPQTLGQASRIAGVTPAAVSLIHVYIEIQGRARGGLVVWGGKEVTVDRVAASNQCKERSSVMTAGLRAGLIGLGVLVVAGLLITGGKRMFMG